MIATALYVQRNLEPEVLLNFFRVFIITISKVIALNPILCQQQMIVYRLMARVIY